MNKIMTKEEIKYLNLHGIAGTDSWFEASDKLTASHEELRSQLHLCNIDQLNSEAEINSLRADLEKTQKMLADRIMDYTQAQGRLEIAVKALNKIGIAQMGGLDYTQDFFELTKNIIRKALAQIEETKP